MGRKKRRARQSWQKDVWKKVVAAVAPGVRQRGCRGSPAGPYFGSMNFTPQAAGGIEAGKGQSGMFFFLNPA